ncbi:hypothetical protein PORY_000178 [Pneumocystis oryctolagi]|uniref:Uncharacterized protein n=1 Tax=Pneumocystis oryctolagi TaxID=42067 RepID=A0ACB7CGC9_9ASCO|nr:hypothetical protein PORY_000178 [Pneumocystis oryctolagi]
MVFVCQQCQSPIYFHHLKEINTATYNLLLEGSCNNFEEDDEEIDSIPLLFPKSREVYYYQTIMHSTNVSVEKNEDYGLSHPIALEKDKSEESHSSIVDSSSDKLEDQEMLLDKQYNFEHFFQTMSSTSNICHPMCVECAETLINTMSKNLHYSKKERDAYIEFLKHIDSNILDDNEIKKIESDIQDVHNLKKKAIALKTIDQLRKERKGIEKEIKKLKKELLSLNEEEETFWKEKNSFLRKLEEFQNERNAVNLQYDYSVKQLEDLQKTNVYNDVFCISHNGQFGTINGLRLGRLPSCTVGWDEINSALGLTLLLLHSIATKLNFEFVGYKLYPLGSASKIDKFEFYTNSSVSPKIVRFELHGSDDLSITRLFSHKNINSAMTCFLKCFKQLEDRLESQNPQFVLPYKIHKDKIGDVSIYMSFNQDERWTRSLKYLLTNAKYLLAYVTQNPSKTHS